MTSLVFALLAALVSVRVTPQVALAPTTVIVTTTIEPSERNREAHVMLVAEDGPIRWSAWSLIEPDGSVTTRKTWQVEWRAIGACRPCEIRAVVVRADGSMATAVVSVDYSSGQ